jgi:hypothetical protein
MKVFCWQTKHIAMNIPLDRCAGAAGGGVRFADFDRVKVKPRGSRQCSAYAAKVKERCCCPPFSPRLI